jgi:flagellar hook-associated protein FlgK
MINSLNVAETGLYTAKQQVEGVMNNIANENTEGYKKRVVNTSELEHIDGRITGRGVVVDSTTRITNVYMYQNLLEEQSKQSSLEQLEVMIDDIESIFDETDDAGLSADLQRYFTSLENLRTSPENEIYKNDLETNGQILVEKIQELYSDIEQLEENSLQSAYDIVDDVNEKLSEIGIISQQILEATTDRNDLLDKRDKLESDLAEYIDIELSRESTYELKIGGQTAVRFDTNVRSLDLVENYTAQKDLYVKEATLPYTSDLIDKSTWGANPGNITAEVQTMYIQGTATGQVFFLGSAISGSASGDTAEDTIDNIIADKTNIIDTWNKNNPNQEIADIVKNSANQIEITYKSTEGDMPVLDLTTSSGIEFGYSAETTKGAADIVTYKLNNDIEVSVAYGEVLTGVDDGNGGTETITVDQDNVIRALVHKISQHTDMKGLVSAYNGEYELDEKGNKILTNNPSHSDYSAGSPNIDRYLVVESNIEGEQGSFVGEVIVTTAGATAADTTRQFVEKSSDFSIEAEDDIHLEIYEEEVQLTGGKLDAIIDNVQTGASENKFESYKEKLDNFAKALSDLSDAYIQNTDDSYVYGKSAVEISSDYEKRTEIGLFSGADVKSLEFNSEKVVSLTQDQLDYLATLQWNEDIDFDGTGDNNDSFSGYYQTLRVEIANDGENTKFKIEAQAAVTESLTNTYDQLTKVDKDEEMVNLIKFQAAYEANAKIITVVDEMIQTILGMKR